MDSLARSRLFNMGNTFRMLAIAVAMVAFTVAGPWSATAVAADGVWTQTVTGGTWTDTANWLGGVVADGAGNTADFSTLDIDGNVDVNLDAPTTIGNLIFGDTSVTEAADGGNWYLKNNGSSANILTLAGTSPTITIPKSSFDWSQLYVRTQFTGTDGLTFTGGGIVNLQNADADAHTYTGATTIDGGTTVKMGFNSMLTSPVDMINSASPLVMNNGTLQIDGRWTAYATSQTFAGTTINGRATIIANLGGNGALSTTVNLGALTHNAGGFVNFTFPSAGAITTSTANDASGILGAWTLTGSGTSLQYVANDGSGNVVAYTGATAAAADLSDVTSATTNYGFSAGTVLPASTTLTANTLRWTGGGATLDIGADANTTNTLTVNGLMNAGTGNLTIARTDNGPDATGGLVIGDTNELAIVTNNKEIIISSPIMDGTGGAGSLTIASYQNQRVQLKGLNTYSGGTILTSGRILAPGAKAGGSDTPLGTGPVTLMAGTKLELSRTNLSNDIDATDAAIESGNSFGSTVSSNIVVHGTVSLMHNNGNGNLDYTGDISGPGGVVCYGYRETQQLGVDLSGTNTFAGPAIAGGKGTLGFVNRVSLPGTGAWTEANLIVEPTATAYFYYGGGSNFTSADIDIIKGLGTDTAGFLDGSYLGFWMTSNASYLGAITDTNGGLNKLGLRKHGDRTLTLGPANTYSGPTKILKGTVVVTSINSVVGGTASSSLGAPTTVEDGTIQMGGSYRDAQITYLGSGETTDRVISVPGNAGNTIIDQSGTGLLKFTSDMDYHKSGKIIRFQGSTAGTGEFAGAIGGTTNAKVEKNGTGTWTLSGTNVYTGTTTVKGGTLNLTGSIASSDAIVNSGAQIAGGGSAKSLTINAGGGFTWSYGDGGDHVLDVVGDLNLEDNWVIKLVDLGDDPLASESYNLFTFATYSGVSSGFGPLSNLVVDATDAPDWDTSGLTISVSGGVVQITGVGSTGLLGDINGDNVVDAADYIILKQNWGNAAGASAEAAASDLDSSGTVGIGDLNLLAGALNAVGGAAVTPEPATLALLAFGGLAVIRRRKQH